MRLARHIIDQSTAQLRRSTTDLALKYGAAHGIGGRNTHHITSRNCDFGYIGGGDQIGGDRTVRFGNGVEFWGDAHDNLVERLPPLGDLRRRADQPERRQAWPSSTTSSTATT